jgi:hypothetical protein
VLLMQTVLSEDKNVSEGCILLSRTRSGDSSELIVFSARAMRSDLRHKLANLIHMTGSSSGLRTNVLT